EEPSLEFHWQGRQVEEDGRLLEDVAARDSFEHAHKHRIGDQSLVAASGVQNDVFSSVVPNRVEALLAVLHSPVSLEFDGVGHLKPRHGRNLHLQRAPPVLEIRLHRKRTGTSIIGRRGEQDHARAVVEPDANEGVDLGRKLVAEVVALGFDGAEALVDHFGSSFGAAVFANPCGELCRPADALGRACTHGAHDGLAHGSLPRARTGTARPKAQWTTFAFRASNSETTSGDSISASGIARPTHPRETFGTKDAPGRIMISGRLNTLSKPKSGPSLPYFVNASHDPSVGSRELG